MCGFVGVVNRPGIEIQEPRFQEMIDVIAHRGPDDRGVYIDENVGLGFRRLSIIDLSPAGHQPMESPDGNFVIVFNGEIYNYVEIRKELIAEGVSFHSKSDTEVLLRAYTTWGYKCLEKLNGMWAFLIYDKSKRTIFGARDRFGKKPLFIYRNEQTCILASEIKSILRSGAYKGQVNWSVAANYLLRDRLEDQNLSFFEGIESIQPGHYFLADQRGNFQTHQYWTLPEPSTDTPSSMDDICREYNQIFEDSVKLRLRSDVPVGVFLSGGIDSTAILCKINQLRNTGEYNEEITAFSYISQQNDESEYIRDTLRSVNANHKIVDINPEKLWDNLPSLISFHDEPLHSMTAMIGDQLYEEASAAGIKVVLNGQGADETAAGYFSYFPKHWEELICRGQWRECQRQVSDYVDTFGGAVSHVFVDSVKGAILRQLREVSRFREYRAGKQNVDTNKGGLWLDNEFTSRCGRDPNPSLDLTLQECYERAVQVTPLPKYLRIEDRNSMAHSVEARLPFLDFRLVELLFQIDPLMKLQGSWNKNIMRESFRGLIPASIQNRRDKMGFPSDVDKWMKFNWREKVMDVLSDRRTRERGIYNLDHVFSEIERHQHGTARVGDKIFKIVQFEIWLRSAEALGVR